MVTFAQAQERAEEWVNGDVPAYQHREVRVREFGLGFVVWAEDRAEGPRSDGGGQRLVIARDSGDATLWPALPVGEVIRRYEEEYGRDEAAEEEPAPAPAARVDLNQTSFLLSPPEWLQEAADRLGIPDRRGATSGGAGGAASGASAGAGPAPGAVPGQAGAPDAPDASWASSGAGRGADASGSGSEGTSGSSGAAASASDGGGSAWPAAGGGADEGTPWAGTDTTADGGEDRSVPLPQTVYAPQVREPGEDGAATPDAKTTLMSGGSALPPTAVAPAVPEGGTGQATPPAPTRAGVPGTPAPGTPAPGAPVPPPAAPGTPDAGDIADAATGRATPPPKRDQGPTPPPPPGAPGTPGGTPAPAQGGASGYVPTQLVSSLGPEGASGSRTPPPPGTPASGTPAPGTPAPPPPGAPGTPGTPPGGVHHAATMLAGPDSPGAGAPTPPGPAPAAPGAPGAPQPPGQPGAPGAPGASAPPGPPGAPGVPGIPGAPQPPAPPRAPGAPGAPGAPRVHHAETVLAAPPAGGPGTPPPPGPPGAPPMAPGAMPPGTPPPGAPAPGRPPAYGYPQQPPGQPTVGPGYQAVLRYRAQDGSEQQLIRRSAPGTPHPEWQIFHELRAMNVPPNQVLELHTELESCELPGAYCARMIREQWPQARITSIAPYGTDHASRQQGMRQLLAHQGELHQVADGPARPAPVRAPVPPVPPAPPIPPEAIGQELAAAFGPGVFRFEQAAVARQGVPPIVAHTLVVAGLPLDMGPFFWAQAQPGRPVPTLAELAVERGVQPAPDAGSYLVMGSDFGKALCVQYGTANIVAVPVEAGPGGTAVAPQFVNTGLPEFARCLALLGRMWRLRFGLNQEQAGRWTVDFQAQLAALDPAALGSPETWWSVLLEQMWDGLL
ncbi:SUKH-4 family immunity protein [Streptomyces sp. MA15]|uniref:SUKH-4 family immunity protein n=1 Tax=Streptomyces sp. MA15 TaxID=3055061 RepID=UPI0025AEE9ED|nr:SUKH-4 family immunity protein [Streptomyces sp. MA15]MDN3266057.1 SUKH-4 family immunity protein [Streptomyces sp. MA15]